MEAFTMDHIRLKQLTAKIEEMRARLANVSDPHARRLLVKQMRECFQEADAIIKTDISAILQNID
jgi:hypothetical protein